MGKKPVLGLIGLAWLGLAVGGCKSNGGCDCDKGVQKSSRDGHVKPWGQPKTQVAADQQTQPKEGTIASKGADPRSQPAYDLDPDSREPKERGSVARQIQDVPQRLPADLSPESTAVMKKPAATPDLLRTGRTTETATGAEMSHQEVQPARTETTAPTYSVPGPDQGDVRPPRSTVTDPASNSVPPSVVEKVGANSPVPPPPPVGATAAMPPETIRTLEPATPPALPTPSPLPSGVPQTPAAEAGSTVAPAGGAMAPTPPSPVGAVPAPAPALQNGVKGDPLPPLPTVPAATPPLPTVVSPYDQVK